MDSWWRQCGDMGLGLGQELCLLLFELLWLPKRLWYSEGLLGESRGAADR